MSVLERGAIFIPQTYAYDTPIGHQVPLRR
jgi:hypothetical protein